MYVEYGMWALESIKGTEIFNRAFMEIYLIMKTSSWETYQFLVVSDINSFIQLYVQTSSQYSAIHLIAYDGSSARDLQPETFSPGPAA